ncbi:DUF7133 domain-containing protein [Jiulongibacter sp. NS-SX5]|uniref:DUF7133 domain-containing protein n=1 Tax=Jiulongibacter sp. NS-SX5 TaxID=3463854 RepID=UPI004058B5A8
MKASGKTLFSKSVLLVCTLFLFKCQTTQRSQVKVSTAELEAQKYPKVSIPITADTSSAYWKGIDIEPKPPVLPLTVEQEKEHFILQDGFEMNTVLTEPQIQQPGAISFDGNGRMYVLELRSYMLTADSDGTLEPVSGISRWEDTDNDGVYETGGMFVDNLVFPRFVLPYGPDCILTMESNQDNVYKYTDTDGDGKADKKEFFCGDFGRAGNVEHQQAFLYWGMDNWLYSTVNPFRVREVNGQVLRESTASNHAQWGITHDDDGKLWFQGGSNGVPSYWQFPVHLGDYVVKAGNFEEGFREPWGAAVKVADMQAGMRAVRQPDGSLNQVTGAAGNDIFRGDRLPSEIYGEYFYGEPVARIVRQVSQKNNEGITELRNPFQSLKTEFISSTDPLFRPVDMTTAPDGTMYITDMYHGIIQEGEWAGEGSYLRVKIEQYQLDKVIGLGRIWRLSHRDFERDSKQPRMFEESSSELVKHLEHPNGWWRDKAQQLLVLRQDMSVVDELIALVEHSSNTNARIHALWVLEGLGQLPAELVKRLMKSDSQRIQMAAMWVGESLYKAGDKSLASLYLNLIEHENVDLAIRAMQTAKMLKIEGVDDQVRLVKEQRTENGIQLVAEQILNPPVVHSFFGRNNPNYSEAEKESLARGQKIYKELCSTCHGLDGRGTPVGESLMAPSFVGNKNVRSHSDYIVKTILRGVTGDIEGKSYEGVVMVPMNQNDDQWVADVASFVRAGFENETSLIGVDQVARVRAETAEQSSPYLYSDLKKSIPKEIPLQESWTVTASHAVPLRKGGTGEPVGAFNFEGWSTGEDQQKEMFFEVDFKGTSKLTEVHFASKGIPQGHWRDRLPPIETYPRKMKIEVSVDDKSWTKVWEGNCTKNTTVIRFEKPSMARKIRFTLTDKAEAPWRMEDLTFYEMQ